MALAGVESKAAAAATVDGAIREGRRVDARLGEGSRRRERADEARERWRVVAVTIAENGGERKGDGGSGRRRCGDCNGGGRSVVEAVGRRWWGRRERTYSGWKEKGKEGREAAMVKKGERGHGDGWLGQRRERDTQGRWGGGSQRWRSATEARWSGVNTEEGTREVVGGEEKEGSGSMGWTMAGRHDRRR